jgi:hypothetical protein
LAHREALASAGEAIAIKAMAVSMRGDSDAVRFGDLNINDQIEFGRQLEGQVGDLRALQNFFHIVRGATIRFRSVIGPRERHPASKLGERFAQMARPLQEKSCPGA